MLNRRAVNQLLASTPVEEGADGGEGMMLLRRWQRCKLSENVAGPDLADSFTAKWKMHREVPAVVAQG